MYWIFFTFFIVGVLVPDIIRTDVGFFSEERVEEIILFCLGVVGFSIFIIKEKQLFFEKKKRKAEEKKLDKTGKDLLQSYGYIGEVNRKMDMLMGLALGLYSSSKIDKKEEKDFYFSIAKASRLLLKGKNCFLIFVDIKKEKPTKTIFLDNKKMPINIKELSKLGGDINIKKEDDFVVVSSPNKMNGVRSYLVIKDYDIQEEAKPKNLEILKVLASQSLFLYSFMDKFSDKN